MPPGEGFANKDTWDKIPGGTTIETPRGASTIEVRFLNALNVDFAAGVRSPSSSV